MTDLARDEIEQLVNQTLMTAEAFAAETRAQIVDAVVAGQAIDELLEDYRMIAGNLQAQADIAGFVRGMQEVASRLPRFRETAAAVEGFELFGVPRPLMRLPLIERAAEDLLSRQIVTRAEFDTMARDVRARAFTVAYEDTTDAIETIRDVLAEQVTEGASLAGFRNELEERLGKSRLGPAHLETVYRTNIQAAFTRGHDELANNPVVQSVFPFREYIAVRDGRTRDTHLALESLGLEGTNIYWADDEFWSVFRIPWDYNCRCASNLLTLDAAADRGLKVAQRWKKSGEKPETESRLPAIPFRPSPQFS